jgi:hypothetical protein
VTFRNLPQSVARLKKKLREVEAFDPSSVALARGADVRTLEESIHITIEQIFGTGTPAYERFQGACYIGEGSGSDWKALLHRNKER